MCSMERKLLVNVWEQVEKSTHILYLRKSTDTCVKKNTVLIELLQSNKNQKAHILECA